MYALLYSEKNVWPRQYVATKPNMEMVHRISVTIRKIIYFDSSSSSSFAYSIYAFSFRMGHLHFAVCEFNLVVGCSFRRRFYRRCTRDDLSHWMPFNCVPIRALYVLETPLSPLLLTFHNILDEKWWPNGATQPSCYPNSPPTMDSNQK